MSNGNAAIIKEFRENKGMVGGHFENSTLLLLHTLGAKSGEARLNPTVCLQDGDRLIILASNNARDSHPAWYHNIVANPDVTVEFGVDKFSERAKITEEPERSELFAKMVAANPFFGDYPNMTDRVIPVIAINRK
jgi:deazaflavin-dependent oxidoreductase (nitroreductase family)